MLDKSNQEAGRRREMKKEFNPAEKRLHPRLEHNLPVKIASCGYDFETTTHNISCLGAYCTINKYIPPFTKVMVKLTLPISTGDSRTLEDVECFRGSGADR